MPYTKLAVLGFSTPINKVRFWICLQKPLSFLHIASMWGPSSGSLQREHSGSVAVKYLRCLLEGSALKAPLQMMSLILGGISFFHLNSGLVSCGAHLRFGGWIGIVVGGLISFLICL